MPESCASCAPLGRSKSSEAGRTCLSGSKRLRAEESPICVLEVERWYLGIYIDAIEWVEMPNTRGMSQFADGGLIATKPYAASGSYINKMSDYCKGCHYDVKERFSEQACPFNSLYWHFLQRHSERFSNNPRTAMAYRTWDKMDPQVQKALLSRADDCLTNLEQL